MEKQWVDQLRIAFLSNERLEKFRKIRLGLELKTELGLKLGLGLGLR
jgi:hypothetical protein